MSIYPSQDIVSQSKGQVPAAVISYVQEDSPAYDAGFEPGCKITAVNGQPLRDIIDWRWQAADDVITVDYIDLDGEAGTVELERDFDEEWGFEFQGVVFDKIKLCRNACTFCFMHQLPQGMRSSLSLRDDDFRLSFLSGTFVTMTNLTAEDEERIVEQHISPLRVSLHAVSANVRQRLMGKHQAHGLEAIERLLNQGIEMHAQIVLVPDANDGEELSKTLTWAYEHPGIVELGIVPLGYTRFQNRFDHSFNEPQQAQAVLDLVTPFQQRALSERGHAWVFAADEFYRNAYGEDLLAHLPEAESYGDFGMFEDGVGIIRSVVDDWNEAVQEGLVSQCAQVLEEAGATVYLLLGYAMTPFFPLLVKEGPLASGLQVVPVENQYFGGNVDVTGLLTAADVQRAVEGLKPQLGDKDLVMIPDVVLNDDMVLLDDGTLEGICQATGVRVVPVSCNPTDYLVEIMQLL